MSVGTNSPGTFQTSFLIESALREDWPNEYREMLSQPANQPIVQYASVKRLVTSGKAAEAVAMVERFTPKELEQYDEILFQIHALAILHNVEQFGKVKTTEIFKTISTYGDQHPELMDEMHLFVGNLQKRPEQKDQILKPLHKKYNTKSFLQLFEKSHDSYFKKRPIFLDELYDDMASGKYVTKEQKQKQKPSKSGNTSAAPSEIGAEKLKRNTLEKYSHKTAQELYALSTNVLKESSKTKDAGRKRTAEKAEEPPAKKKKQTSEEEQYFQIPHLKTSAPKSPKSSKSAKTSDDDSESSAEKLLNALNRSSSPSKEKTKKSKTGEKIQMEDSDDFIETPKKDKKDDKKKSGKKETTKKKRVDEPKASSRAMTWEEDTE